MYVQYRRAKRKTDLETKIIMSWMNLWVELVGVHDVFSRGHGRRRKLALSLIHLLATETRHEHRYGQFIYWRVICIMYCRGTRGSTTDSTSLDYYFCNNNIDTTTTTIMSNLPHFSPMRTGQPPCTDRSFASPLGFVLYHRTAEPSTGEAHTSAFGKQVRPPAVTSDSCDHGIVVLTGGAVIFFCRGVSQLFYLVTIDLSSLLNLINVSFPSDHV